MPALDMTQRCPALLVIDSQNDFVTTGTSAGAVSTEDATESLARIADLISAAHDSGMPVVFTQEAHRVERVDFGRELDGDEGVHCLEGSHGVDFRKETRPQRGDFIVVKRRYSGFFATDLEILLRGLGVDTLVICGYGTDVCVHYTSVDAHQHDYRVFVVEDATGGTSPGARVAALAAIEYLQCGSVVGSADCIAGMSAGFRGPRTLQDRG
jgi:nicotinamidase-related amidase